MMYRTTLRFHDKRNFEYNNSKKNFSSMIVGKCAAKQQVYLLKQYCENGPFSP